MWGGGRIIFNGIRFLRDIGDGIQSIGGGDFFSQEERYVNV